MSDVAAREPRTEEPQPQTEEGRHLARQLRWVPMPDDEERDTDHGYYWPSTAILAIEAEARRDAEREIGALREALGELLWWSEFMQDPDWAKKDVADTD